MQIKIELGQFFSLPDFGFDRSDQPPAESQDKGQSNELLRIAWPHHNPKNTELEFLDLGCGQGRDSLFMLQKGFAVTAIDNLYEDIDNLPKTIKANKLPKDKATLVCGNMKNFKR